MGKWAQKLSYRELGLKVGLEIHQQLDTKRKLFCNCKPELVEEEGDVFYRRLRPVRSEMGEVDIAALFEWKKGRTYEYHAPRVNTCLVEADEEPPHSPAEEAILIALGMAKALGSKVVDEIHTMRKMVIDGSNTSGFQRTMLIALGGKLRVKDKEIGIETICVEEDAARKEGERGNVTTYKLDRLGIPLIEIATAPDITSPQEAKEVALKIGQMLRLTRKVKRGLGTIRQDLNVSIKGGAKTEIKGVQRLDIIDKVIEYEVMRQLNLLKIRDELRRRGVTKEEILKEEPSDVTDILKGSESRLVKRVLRSGKAMGVRLPKFKGLLGVQIMPNRRFGTELADYARFWAGVGGILHSDELPGYGISEKEVRSVAERLGCNNEDAFVIVLAPEEQAKKAIEAVKERAAAALDGVPEETRAALDDGTTRFMRPRPGGARMYPETDIPTFEISKEILEKAELYVPEDPEEMVKKLVMNYNLPEEMAKKMIMSIRLDLFKKMLEKYSDKVPSTIIARAVEDVPKELAREGLNVDKISDEAIEKVIESLAAGKIAKEAIPEVLKLVAEGVNVDEAIRKFSEKVDVDKVVNEVVMSLKSEIARRGKDRSFGLVMGRVMAKLRGKVDGKIVAKKVKEALERLEI